MNANIKGRSSALSEYRRRAKEFMEDQRRSQPVVHEKIPIIVPGTYTFAVIYTKGSTGRSFQVMVDRFLVSQELNYKFRE